MAKKTNYPKTMYVFMSAPPTTKQYGRGEAFESPVQFEGEPLVGEYKFVQAGRIECSSKFVPFVPFVPGEK
ncbi:MAG TPA: hypothetical protein VFI60_05790 [Candidatus Acidoferrum sp.]|nr:hypothetical protein [Candidatus Acidoferrum sp.]